MSKQEEIEDAVLDMENAKFAWMEAKKEEERIFEILEISWKKYQDAIMKLDELKKKSQ